MKKYTKPTAEIEIFDSTDIITLSSASVQAFSEDDEDYYSTNELGLNK